MQQNVENRTPERAGFVSIDNPRGFDAEMPTVRVYFDDNATDF